MIKISEVIAELQNIQKEFGDLPCYYAPDDEGNYYLPVVYLPSVVEDGGKDICVLN